MSLEQKIRTNKISRRQFLQTTLKALIITGGTTLLWKCKNNVTGPEPTEPPHPVTIRATFYNHVEGPLGTKEYQGLSDNPLTIKITDAPNTNNIDPSRIIIRQAAYDGYLGNLIGVSSNGEINTTYPKQNEEWHIYLMKKQTIDGTVDYDFIDRHPKEGINPKRHCTWQREDRDNQTGPTQPILEAVKQLNQALKYPWATYGSMTQAPKGQKGDIGIGYGYAYGGAGLHSDKWAGVDANKMKTDSGKLLIFLAEIFECRGTFDTPYTADIITTKSSVNLSRVGAALFAYLFLKDSRTGKDGLPSSKIKFVF